MFNQWQELQDRYYTLMELVASSDLDNKKGNFINDLD